MSAVSWLLAAALVLTGCFEMLQGAVLFGVFVIAFGFAMGPDAFGFAKKAQPQEI